MSKAPCFSLIQERRHSSDHREETDTKKYLQDQLKLEMEEHIRGNMPR